MFDNKNDKSDVLELTRPAHRHFDPLSRLDAPVKGQDESEEDSCPAFGFLRGVRDRALALELRHANGNSDWYSYSCLVSWRFNPSVGLLLKFTGDLVTLVLIRGSNLAFQVNGSVDLPHGIQRHRVMWIREMEKAEAKQIGQSGPTIDKIEVAEFETHEDLEEWLDRVAPAFKNP